MIDLILIISLVVLQVINTVLIVYFGAKTTPTVSWSEAKPKVAAKSSQKIKPKVPYWEHDYEVGQ